MATRNKGKRLSKYVTDYIVFDLETTGINPDWDAIIEISAVKVCGGKCAAEYFHAGECRGAIFRRGRLR